MHSKKHQTDIEELLEIASSTTEEVSPIEFKNDIESLIIRMLLLYKIEPGKEKMTGKYLHALFRKTYPEADVGPTVFSRYIGYHLPFDGDYFSTNMRTLSVYEQLNHLNEKNRIAANSFTNPSKIRHIKAFITNNNIIAGKDPIKFMVIFYLYTEWCYDTKKTCITYPKFRGYFKKLMTQYFSGGVSYVDIDFKKLKEVISEERYKKAKAWSENKRETKSFRINYERKSKKT